MSLNSNNFLSTTGYSLSVRTPDGLSLSAPVQNFTHPAVSISNAVQPSPRRDIPLPGDKYVYDPLTIQLLLDEDMVYYKALYDWMISCVEESDNPRADKTSDLEIHIRSNKGNRTSGFKYICAFPSDLGAVNFLSTDETDQYVQLDATFQYSHFTMT